MSFPAYNDLSSFQGPQANETEQFVSYLNGYLGTQHKDDGSHGNVTADSIHVVKGNPTTGTSTGTGNLTVDGTVTAAGTGASTFAGDVTADSPTSPITLGAAVGSLGGADGVTGSGVSVSTAGTPVRQWAWVLFDNGPVNHRGLRLLDIDGGFAPLEIQANNLGGNYWMAPGPVSSGSKTFDLGTTYYGFGQARWNNLYLAASLFEQNRTTAVGFWTDVAFAAGNFTASSGTWTVTAGEQALYRYTLIGKTMTLAFEIDTSTVSGGQHALRIAIPGGALAAKNTFLGGLLYNDNGTGYVSSGTMSTTAGAAYVALEAGVHGTTTWSASVTNTTVTGVFTFEIQ